MNMLRTCINIFAERVAHLQPLHLAACLLLATIFPAHADTITLNNGTVKEGQIVKEDDTGVTLEVRIGGLKGRVTIPHHEIRSIERKPLTQTETEKEAERLQKLAESKTGIEAATAWGKLGKFYSEREGYMHEARQAYRKAIEFDPDAADARQYLGHQKNAEGWQETNDLRRERGLVPLDDIWVRPAERSLLIDKRHEEELGELRIGARQERKYTIEEARQLLALEEARRKIDRENPSSLRAGEELLSRYGYYNPTGVYIGSGYAPYYADGVGLSYGDNSVFVGRVGTGPYYPYYSYYKDCSPRFDYGCGRRYVYSPGIVYRGRNFRFSFGTNLSGGYGCYSSYGRSAYSGFGLNFRGGSRNFKYNVNIGGGRFGY